MISRNYTYAFLTGITCGVVAAALYAPQSGQQTRIRIRKALDEAGDSLTEAGSYLRGEADRLNAEVLATVTQTQTQVQSVLEQASSALNQTLKQASDSFASNSGLASDAIKTVLAIANRLPGR